MMVEGKYRCINCMRKMNIVRRRCLYCGFSQESYRPAPYHMNPGTVLAARYSIGRVLQEGTYGILYLAWDLILEQKVAMKEYFPKPIVKRDLIRGTESTVLTENDSEMRRGRERFQKEAENLSRFSKLDAIPSILDYFEENGTAYIVMHYISGMPLQQYVEQKGSFREEQMKRLIYPLLLTLAEIHKTGLLHRDINPSNILYQKEKKLVLTDFGSMQMRGAEKKCTIRVTKGYAPYELYLPEEEEGPWTDTYAICAVMQFMLTGEAPKPEKRLTGISERCQYILQKGLSERKCERYANMPQLEADLRYKENG